MIAKYTPVRFVSHLSMLRVSMKFWRLMIGAMALVWNGHWKMRSFKPLKFKLRNTVHTFFIPVICYPARG